MFLLLSRLLALSLIVYHILGCGADDSSISDEISTVTIEIVESVPGFQQEKEGILFRLNAVPAPITDIAVLIESEMMYAAPEDAESGYTWIIIPEFMNSKEFSLVLDQHVSWVVAIRRLSDVNLNAYPIAGFDIPADFRFRKYAVGSPSRVKTVPTTANLQSVWPRYSQFDRVPANGILVLTFDVLPENIGVSHGRIVIDNDVVKVVGPFPLGELELEIVWDDGYGSDTVRRIITEPDFEPPDLLQAIAFNKDGFGVIFDTNGWVFLDTEKIELAFSEAIWVNEDIHGNIDIQTVAGDSLGWEWEVKFRLPNSNEIVLVRSDGKPLSPRTNYVVVGTVTDLANEIKVKIPLTTTD